MLRDVSEAAPTMARTWIQAAGMVETMGGSFRDVENWFFRREFEDFPNALGHMRTGDRERIATGGSPW